ncbi:MAG TPA: hypothetical protein ENG40_01025 [Thermoprotei archaeon]|nr:hypothetical protein [Thermoprotei archaeon]
MLAKVNERYIIEYSIKTITPLHIGSGERIDIPKIDLPILRLSDGTIFIPGSSIKGVVRSELEEITSGLGFKICIENRGWDPVYSCSEEKHCISCALFGSTEMSSRVFFRDAYVSQDKGVFIKPGIAINRESKTTRKGSLFTSEYVNPGTIFKSEIVFLNPEPGMLGLLFLTLKSVKSIGGHVSRGAGKIEINIEKIVVETPQTIVGLKSPVVYTGEELKKFIEKCEEEFRIRIDDMRKKYVP